MARDRKDAEGAIREILANYRKYRESLPDLATQILRASLDKHFQIADLALSIKCADVADDQYRIIKRLLRNVNMPAYQERLKAAMAGLKKSGG